MQHNLFYDCQTNFISNSIKKYMLDLRETDKKHLQIHQQRFS
jgi:hypothetical protein